MGSFALIYQSFKFPDKLLPKNRTAQWSLCIELTLKTWKATLGSIKIIHTQFVKWINWRLGYKCFTCETDFTGRAWTLARAKWPQVQLKLKLYVLLNNCHEKHMQLFFIYSQKLCLIVYPLLIRMLFVLLFVSLCDSSSSCPQNMSLLSGYTQWASPA